MKKLRALSQFLSTQNLPVSIFDFTLDILLAALLSYILSRIYIRYGTSLSNRKMFANNFLLIGMTTMLIISIVKASLALSLGLVGALSIVRFRAAIKEPEELSYLFLTIGIGLGLGANQRLITITSFLIIIGIIIGRRYFQKKDGEGFNTLVLAVSSHNPHKVGLEEIVEILKNNCSRLTLKRMDEKKDILEASFLVEFHDFDQFLKGKKELQSLNEAIDITFLDNRGIL